MHFDEFIRTKREELLRLEHSLEQEVKRAGRKMSTQLDSVRTMRDDFVARLDGLKGEAVERADVLKMGLESAFAELRTAFEMVTAELNPEPKG